MFKLALNRALLRIEITTVSPLLIRAGDSGLNPAAAELACIRTRHGRLGDTVFIPGASLKGVIRSTAESVLRTTRGAGPGQGACDPLDNQTNCGKRIRVEDTTATDAIHKAHCLACRLFGSTALRGRCAVHDLFPTERDGNVQNANRVEVRHGVGIDRIAGSVRTGPYDFEMIPAGVAFYGEITLTNYQAWQLGLVAMALQEIDEGFAQLGSTKSRGLGVVQAKVVELVHEQTIRGAAHPQDVAALMEGATQEGYGLFPAGELPVIEGENLGLSRRFRTDETRPWLRRGLKALEALA